jgi:monofunctional biosynthetic peptidoglycan transglycosylase
MSRQSPAPRRPFRTWLWRALLLFVITDSLYLFSIWPDWSQLASGPMPRSSFMQTYQQERSAHPDWPPLRWQPVMLAQMPRYLLRTVLVAEDARFYEHEGFDLQALREVLDYNLERGRVVYGASTISQQTVKNLFLSPSRNPLRKWHEMLLTWRMEQHLDKRRILELYLNSAEFGQGIYGVQAAAQHYWGISAAQLSSQQAIELAATLPSPLHDNPATRTRAFQRRVAKIVRHL